VKPPKAADALFTGDLIAGKYRVEATIAEGGMGLIVRAMHLDLDRRVAIKIIRDELAEREDMLARLLLEARAVARMRSEHVARVLDVGRLERGGPFIVMEYLDGKDLWTVLHEEGKLPPRLAVDYVVQVCEALAEAHALGIVHRDVKPENLFRASAADGAPIIKLLDFGISKHENRCQNGRITGALVAVGSPHYMSPEQLRADPDVDGRADIWALGVILYELVSGISPFHAESLPKICARVTGEEPPRLCTLCENFPEALEAVIFACMQKDRDKRPATVAELARVLAPFGTAETARRSVRVARILRGSTMLPVPASLASSASASEERELTPSRAPTSLMPVMESIPPPVAKRRAPARRWRGAAVITVALSAAAAVGVFALTRWRIQAPTEVDPAAAQTSILVEAPIVPAVLSTRPLASASKPPPPPPARSVRSSNRVERRSAAPRGTARDRSVTTATAAPAASVTAGATIVFETPNPPAVAPRDADSKTEPKPQRGPPSGRPDAWDPRSFGGRH